MLELKIYDGEEKLQELRLESTVISIGRDPGNALVLPDVSVSRRHAQIEPNGNFHLLRDNGSTNGTFVNEMLARAQVLSHGDVVRIGKYVLRVEESRGRKQETTRVRVEALRLPGRRGRGGKPSGGIVYDGETSLADASRERLLRLYEIQREIGYIDKTAALLDRALEIILDELDADRGAILLRDSGASREAREARDGGDPIARGQRAAGDGTSGRERADGTLRPAAVRSRPEALREHGPDAEIVIPQDLLHEATQRAHGARRPTGTYQEDDSGISRIAAPLRERRRLRGVVYLERSLARGAFSGEDLQFLNAIASQTAISLANAELFDEVSLEKEKVQTILGSLTDGLIVTDRDFRVTDANAATAVILGLEGRIVPGVDLVKLLAGFRVSPEPSVLKTAALRESLLFHLFRDETDEPGARTGERAAEKASGRGAASRTMVAGRILPFRRDGGEARGALVLLRDRTETLRLEEIKTGFIGDIAHKLRTPLTVIEGNLPFLRQAGGDGLPPREILDEIERNSRSLCSLIDQFIEYTELEVRSIQQPGALEPLRPKDLVRQALEAVLPEAERRGVIIVEKVAADMPPVKGRRERLVGALRHIIENAVKFGGQGGQVVIHAEPLGDHVRIDLVDDGPGIPQREIEAVFQVFHQVDAERTGQVPGAGLGLAIARHIIQEHGGEVEITSPFRFADRGTRVSIRLPADQGDRRAGASIDAPSTHAPSTDAPSTHAPSTHAPSTHAASTDGASMDAVSVDGASTDDASMDAVSVGGASSDAGDGVKEGNR